MELLKKKDRGADIKTGLFMEESDTWAAVDAHNPVCVSGSERGGITGVFVSAWELVYRFSRVMLRKAAFGHVQK